MWLLYFGFLIVDMLLCIACFEALIYRLYKYHPRDWEKAGSPIVSGLNIGPASFGKLSESWVFSRFRLQKQFLLRTPSWIINDSIARKILTTYRIILGLYLAGVFGFLILALLSS